MWILIRLTLALIGFAVRQLARRGTPPASTWVEGRPIYERLLTARKRGVIGFVIGMDRRSPTWIRLHAESAADRAFKRLGLANEVQTGDDEFDEQVYVTCDHPYVHALLAEDDALRQAVRTTLASGFHRIQFDGHHVWIEKKSESTPGPGDHRVLADLQAAAARLEDEAPSRLADPFVWRAVAIEGVIWGLAGYALGGVLELVGHHEDYYPSSAGLLRLGLYASGVVSVALLALIVVWMRGSSRGHRVIVESVIVLLFALPVAGYQLAADTNRALDHGPPRIEQRQVQGCARREHRRRRGGTSVSYHVQFADEVVPATGTPTPSEIHVTGALCASARDAGTLTLEVMPGRWGVAWYREIRTGDVVWRHPDA